MARTDRLESGGGGPSGYGEGPAGGGAGRLSKIVQKIKGSQPNHHVTDGKNTTKSIVPAPTAEMIAGKERPKPDLKKGVPPAPPRSTEAQKDAERTRNVQRDINETKKQSEANARAKDVRQAAREVDKKLKDAPTNQQMGTLRKAQAEIQGRNLQHAKDRGAPTPPLKRPNPGQNPPAKSSTADQPGRKVPEVKGPEAPKKKPKFNPNDATDIPGAVNWNKFSKGKTRKEILNPGD